MLAAGAELIPVETIRQAMTAVREGAADAACVPIENSVEGVVPATLDALSEAEPLVAVTVVIPAAAICCVNVAGSLMTINAHRTMSPRASSVNGGMMGAM